MLFSKKLLYFQNAYPKLFTSPAVTQMVLVPGTYRLVLRGGGGAGGTNGANQTSYPGKGVGGAGGKGSISSSTITVTAATIAEIHVGAGGQTGELGNGGSNGGGIQPGGNGGGGGLPSYIVFSSQSNLRMFYGWQAQFQYGATYNQPTTVYYVNYDENDPTVPVTITTTSSEYTMDSFSLVHGTHYSPNDYLLTAGPDGGINIQISLGNRTATLQGSTVALDGRTVTPVDVSGDFTGNLVYTETEVPEDNDDVFVENENSNTFSAVGVVVNFSDLGRDHFIFSQDNITYYRYQENDKEEHTQTFSSLYYALGGGGGGGGGGFGDYGRLRHAGSGGGGGGFYRIDSSTGVITSVPGQTGGASGGNDDGTGGNGRTGNITDFPNITSGKGGRGVYDHDHARGYGGNGASGGGASGAGGGGGAGNHSSAWSGGGGGGAGGCYDAGGGTAGFGAGESVNDPATDASNPHTTPTDTTAENATYGVIGDYGIGGTTATNGTDGFVFIEKIS